MSVDDARGEVNAEEGSGSGEGGVGTKERERVGQDEWGGTNGAGRVGRNEWGGTSGAGRVGQGCCRRFAAHRIIMRLNRGLTPTATRCRGFATNTD